MKKLFKKIAKKNIKEVRAELARAHLIIAMLSIAVIALLALGATQPVTFDPTLSAICVVLLSIVAIVSLSTALNLFRKK